MFSEANSDYATNGSNFETQVKDFAKYAKDYATIIKVVNGEMFLTNEEMSKLCEVFPDLTKHLKPTSQGWTLESAALDGVLVFLMLYSSIFPTSSLDNYPLLCYNIYT